MNMKKILLIVVAAVMATSVFAQEMVKKVRVYNDNARVYERNYADVDSIVFVDVSALPEGALIGEFSVSASKKVHFSKGNLQATTTDLGVNWTWGFATNQWDYIGDAAANNAIIGNKAVSSNGTVDLFGWSTNATYYGINNGTDNNTYFGYFVDWGTAIGEGWYTLSTDEWVYLFCGRTDAAHLFSLGTVNGVSGTILLPDNWEGDKFTDTDNGLEAIGFYYENGSGTNFSFHTYTAEQWDAMENAGAVFLPAAGNRDGTEVYSVGFAGFYWSSTLFFVSTPYAYNALYISFSSYDLYSQLYGNRYAGLSVRLVR